MHCIDGVDASITGEHWCLIRSCQEIQSKWLYASYFCSNGETNYPSAFELWVSVRVPRQGLSNHRVNHSPINPGKLLLGLIHLPNVADNQIKCAKCTCVWLWVDRRLYDFSQHVPTWSVNELKHGCFSMSYALFCWDVSSIFL